MARARAPAGVSLADAALAIATFGVSTTFSTGVRAAETTGTAISTFRYTQQGETFFHYGYASQAENFAGGLRPAGFATDIGSLTGAEAKSGLSLPHATPPDAVYTVTPSTGTLVNVNPVTRPQFGQPGGLVEFQFPAGTGSGTVSPPRTIP